VDTHHHALHRCRGIIADLPGSVATVVLWHHDAPAIRGEENFGGVKPHTIGGIAWSCHAIAIYLPRLHALYVYMPVVVRTVSHGIKVHHARRPGVVFSIKQ